MITGCAPKEKNMSLHPAFVHTVYFWLQHPDNKTDRELFESSLKKFLKNSQYAKTKFIGSPMQSDREVVDDTYTYSLIVSFDSKEEQDLYQKEDAHLLFIKEASHVWSKVIVYDSTHIQ